MELSRFAALILWQHEVAGMEPIKIAFFLRAKIYFICRSS